ncbi:UNVERIFIED_CONTAM: putative mitochondrial protein [Sesamum calycinum]|uniref:Mitochondrial protein n=1 Tax=Sesamum calycinum TaxID=2727403 RepID=A0AAW2N1T3_9LAMI
MAMDDKMSTLISRGTWELVEVPPNADVVACRWVFTPKFRADGTLECQSQPADVSDGHKNAFLYGDFNKTVYMEQPHGYVAQGEKQRMNDDDNYLEDKTKYRRLVGKLIYLTVTRPDISFAFGLVSHFMDKPRLVHWEVALRILKYIKASPVARSSVEAEYRAMAHTTSEIFWLKNLLKELGFMYDDPVHIHYDNQAAIHIASNPIFYKRTKHIEVDCHFVREAVMSQKICTPFTPSEQRADIFTKALGSK